MRADPDTLVRTGPPGRGAAVGVEPGAGRCLTDGMAEDLSTDPSATGAAAASAATTPRQLADSYLDAVTVLDPVLATGLGLASGQDQLPDLSPRGADELAALRARTLDRLELLVRDAGGLPELEPEERRCARLLRERLEAAQAVYAAGEHLCDVGTIFSPVQSLRSAFILMNRSTPEQFADLSARLAALPRALAGYRQSLQTGADQGLVAAPRQVRAVADQLRSWVPEAGRGWFSGLVSTPPEGLEQDAAGRAGDRAAAADQAVLDLAGWLERDLLPVAEQQGRDAVGRERYARSARYWTGADLDLDEAYTWGWAELARIDADLRAEAEKVRPDAGVAEAVAWLEENGEAVEGVEAVRARLQTMLDEAVAALDGTHMDLAEPIRTVEAMIAPPGSAAAPYYTRPSLDFSRPGRTWLPTLGRERFPMWDLVSTWYHEGVPGHHLQLAQWTYVAPQLSRYQTSLGQVSANCEGWALYAERLMDELGFLTDPGHRLGYLDAQRMRAVRVIIDLGMHLELEIPRDQGLPEAFHPGEVWTPELAREFFGANSGRSADFLDSEILRYLSGPGQAIGYKLGERAWLEGRSQARAAHEADGGRFDLKAWHMAALSQGSLGLDDLVSELAAL